jgi:hypothetical protein
LPGTSKLVLYAKRNLSLHDNGLTPDLAFRPGLSKLSTAHTQII